MTGRRVFVEGLEFWAPQVPGWEVACEALGDGRWAPGDESRRPAPQLLSASERRRAPQTVLLALEVGCNALARSGRSPDEVLSVFASAHGDLDITDYMCSTLATTPRLVSPTKFHNSVHNAPSGYWGIATGSFQASTSVSAYDCSFAAGLLETLTQCAVEGMPVLLVGYDIAACGALISTNNSRGMLGVGLVVAPQATPRTLAILDWDVVSGMLERPSLHSKAARSLAGNAMADALPLFEALARQSRKEIPMPLGDGLLLSVQWSFLC